MVRVLAAHRWCQPRWLHCLGDQQAHGGTAHTHSVFLRTAWLAAVLRVAQAYIGEGQLNTAEPGDFTAWIFYRTFRNPRHITSRIVYFQIAVCGSQILCLLMARRREAVIGWATMIGFSYAVLYFTLTVRRKIVTRNTAVN